MCGCDYCNQRMKVPAPDCCPNCDAAEARLEQQRVNDFTAGGTA